MNVEFVYIYIYIYIYIYVCVYVCVQIHMYISHNFTKIGVVDQGLPDPYSSVSVGTNEGLQSLPLDTLALLARLIGFMVMQKTLVKKN